ncbi:MAG: hypothetical protein ACRDD1_00200, partial [Planctomycetia bacterium]
MAQPHCIRRFRRTDEATVEPHLLQNCEEYESPFESAARTSAKDEGRRQRRVHGDAFAAQGEPRLEHDLPSDPSEGGV